MRFKIWNWHGIWTEQTRKRANVVRRSGPRLSRFHSDVNLFSCGDTCWCDWKSFGRVLFSLATSYDALSLVRFSPIFNMQNSRDESDLNDLSDSNALWTRTLTEGWIQSFQKEIFPFGFIAIVRLVHRIIMVSKHNHNLYGIFRQLEIHLAKWFWLSDMVHYYGKRLVL